MSGLHRETPKVDRARRKARPQEWVAKPKVGDTLGSFRLLKLLGEGGAGVVYQAEHSFLGRPVAIKILHPELYLRPAMVARFFQEALAVNRARHKNIIDITDVVATEGFPPFIVMELLEGEDLGDHIDRHAPLGLGFTVEVARQICDALSVVHRLGIVHRDLKPENIFLARQSSDPQALLTVKLLDFGIAKFIDAEENRRRTWSGNILGTPAYMPMEQLHGLPVDQRADIYSLGVVLYEMLTRHLPFEIDGLEDLADGVLARQPAPPSVRVGPQAPAPIPQAVDAVVMRCLADNPAKRFQSVTDLAEALLAASGLEGVPVDPAATRGSSSRGRPARKGSSDRHPAWPGADARVGTAEPGNMAEALHRQLDTTLQDQSAALPRIPTPPEAAVDGGPSVASASLQGGRRSSRGTLLIGALALLAASILGVVLYLASQGTGRPAHRSPPEEVTGPMGSSTSPLERAVAVESDPPDARIHLAADDSLLGQTPARVRLTEGKPRALVLRKAGYKDALVTLTPGGPDPLRISLEPESPAKPEGDAPDAGAAAPITKPGAPHSVVREATPPDHMRARPMTPPGPASRVTEQGIVDPFPM
ncbi:MAG: protein kinase [Polyangia bacterium]|jgi:serine/threonine-protein kinase|nr:protein kinase [Polyangia bacterium]